MHRVRHGPVGQQGLPLHHHRRGGAGHRARRDLAVGQGRRPGGHGWRPVPVARDSLEPGGAGRRLGHLHVRPLAVDGYGVHPPHRAVPHAPVHQRLPLLAVLPWRAEECGGGSGAAAAPGPPVPIEHRVFARRRRRGIGRLFQEEPRRGRVRRVASGIGSAQPHQLCRHRRHLALRRAGARDQELAAAVGESGHADLHSRRLPGQREGGDHFKLGARQPAGRRRLRR
mmetsp:Transcript_104155/g.301316  ORF Transcript_104155/g.301316 Transcript_104155/m.301316 type:complete len:227 (-) Transcript_104155:854-1534(-)